MNYLQTLVTQVTWTNERLSSFSPKQLKILAGYRPTFSPPMEEHMMQFFQTYPPAETDRSAAYELAGSKIAGDMMKGGALEEGAMSKNGYVRYSTNNVWVTKQSGETECYPNAVIPMPVAKRARQGLFNLVAILSSTIRVDGKTLAIVTPLNLWEKSWVGGDSCIRPPGLIKVLAMMKGVICASDKWKCLSEINRQALTDSRWTVFLTEFFTDCSWEDYFVVHTLVVTDFLKAYREKKSEKDKAKPTHVPWTRVKALKSGKTVVVPFVAKDALMVYTPKLVAALPPNAREAAKKAAKSLGRDPVVMLGPFSGSHKFVSTEDVTFEKAYRAFQAGSTLRGSDSSSVLSTSYGFSGFPTALTRKLILITSTAAHLCTRTTELDIYADSVGIIPIVHQSLINIRQRCAWNCNVKFITSYNDIGKVHPDYRRHCVTSYRPSAHHFWVSAKVIDSAKKPDDVLDKSDQNMSEMGTNSTFFGPIFGRAPFSGKYVYEFGEPADFRSFSSTFSDLCMIGITHTKDGPGDVVHVPLVRVPHETAWYVRVIMANSERNSYFLHPTKHYSPISNVLSPPTKGVVFVVRDGDWTTVADTGASDRIEEEVDTDEDEHYEAVEDPAYDVPEDEAEEEDEDSDDTGDEEEERDPPPQYRPRSDPDTRDLRLDPAKDAPLVDVTLAQQQPQPSEEIIETLSPPPQFLAPPPAPPQPRSILKKEGSSPASRKPARFADDDDEVPLTKKEKKVKVAKKQTPQEGTEEEEPFVLYDKDAYD